MLRFHRHQLVVAVVSTIIAMFIAASTTDPAHAQQGPDVDKARTHYTKAEKAMQAGDYKTAAAEYSAAYDITKDGVLFLKIATAHDKNNDCAQALVFFRRYLAEGNPPEEYKQLANERISACEQKTGPAAGAGASAGGQTPDNGTASTANNAAAGSETGNATTGTAATGGSGTGDATTGAPTDSGSETGDADTGEDATDDGIDPMGGATPPPSFADQKPTWQRNAAWVGVGTSIAFATIGSILSLSASSHEEDIKNLINFRDLNGQPAVYTGNAREQYEELVGEGESLANWSQIALGVAAASAVTAAVFFIIDPGSGEKATSAKIVPTVSPESVGVSAGWRF